MANTVDTIGDKATTEKIVDGSITELIDDKITYIGFGGFQGCTNLRKLDLPNLETLAAQCVYECSRVESVNFPNLKHVDSYSISSISSLKTLSLPSLIEASSWSLSRLGVEKAEFRDIQKLNGSAFANGSSLKYMIFRGNHMCELENRTGLSTKINFYVKRSLLDTYKADSEWSNLADRIFAIEDNLDICG